MPFPSEDERIRQEDWQTGYHSKEVVCCPEIIEVRQAFRDHIRNAEGHNHAHIELTLNSMRADMTAMCHKVDKMIEEMERQQQWQYRIIGGLTVIMVLLTVFGRELSRVIFHTG